MLLGQKILKWSPKLSINDLIDEMIKYELKNKKMIDHKSIARAAWFGP